MKKWWLVVALALPLSAAAVEVLNEQTHWRFVAVYRPPGASPERKASMRWVRSGDECTVPAPPDSWRQPDFSDAGWARKPGAVFGGYGFAYKGDLALLCVRGRFQVDDPGAVRNLSLTLRYRGGVVVHMNGAEVGRGHFPSVPYPAEVLQLRDCGWGAPPAAERALYEARIRELTVPIPPAKLRRGVNVLALELHGTGQPELKWNTTGLVGARLTADAGVAAPVTPRLWAAEPLVRPGVDVLAGDPCEPQVVEMFAPVNGIASGQAVVSGLSNIVATASELTGPGGRIAVQVRYPGVGEGFNPLLDRATSTNACQPVWLTAQVPATATPGRYTGRLSVRDAGEIPVTLEVFGWRVGTPREWRTCVNMLQSPESVAGRYKVPLWSAEHFRLLEPSFALLGAAGNDVLGVNAVARTVFGNDPLVVFRREGERWVPDLQFLERYLRLYDQHAGAPQFLNVQVWHYGMSSRGFGRDGGGVTNIAETIPIGELRDGAVVTTTMPMYGRPGTAAPWREALAGIRALVTKLGWRDTTVLLGTGGDNWPNPEIVAFFQEIAPGTPWRVITHGSGCPKWGVTDAERLQPNGMTVAYLEMARRIAFAEPRVPGHPRTCNARDCLGGTDPFAFRSLTPCNVINAHYDGFCWKGLDYWSYSNPTGGVRSALNTDVGFGNIVGTTPRTIAWPGPTGAVATVQYEMLRAGIQDTEAAWHIWAVLDDPQRRAKLPPDLVNRAQTAIAELADMYETGLRGGPQGGNDVRGFVNRLHAVAAEVTAATGTQ